MTIRGLTFPFKSWLGFPVNVTRQKKKERKKGRRRRLRSWGRTGVRTLVLGAVESLRGRQSWRGMGWVDSHGMG